MKTIGHPAVASVGRRQFLRGLRKGLLAIPTLPSLLSSATARAQQEQPQRSLAYFILGHGGCSQLTMFPNQRLLTDSQAYAGHTIRRGTLKSEKSNGQAKVSDVLQAPDSALTDALLAKMNVLRGVDFPFYVGHGFGPALGNFSDNTGGAENSAFAFPTIDQVLAWAPSFYKNSPPRERVLTLGGPSWGFSNPSTQTGSLIRVADSAPSNIDLFDKLFGASTPMIPSGTAPRRPLVDTVLESYKRLRNSGRLSKVDTQRLDDHLQRLSELQRRLSVPPPTPPNASRPSVSTGTLSDGDFAIDPKAHIQKWNLWTDIVSIAFSVGASRVFSAFVSDSFSDDPRDWHEVVHSAFQTDASAAPFFELITAANRRFFQSVILEMARKLEAIAGPQGGSVLDQSLIVFGHESGAPSHSGYGGPLITFGSAGNRLRTGQYCDYRNLSNSVKNLPIDDKPRMGEEFYYGLTLQQWLGTVLGAMGVPPSEYAGLAGGAGYPNANTAGTDAGYYPSSVWTAASDALPWLRV